MGPSWGRAAAVACALGAGAELGAAVPVLRFHHLVLDTALMFGLLLAVAVVGSHRALDISWSRAAARSLGLAAAGFAVGLQFWQHPGSAQVVALTVGAWLLATGLLHVGDATLPGRGVLPVWRTAARAASAAAAALLGVAVFSLGQQLARVVVVGGGVHAGGAVRRAGVALLMMLVLRQPGRVRAWALLGAGVAAFPLAELTASVIVRIDLALSRPLPFAEHLFRTLVSRTTAVSLLLVVLGLVLATTAASREDASPAS